MLAETLFEVNFRGAVNVSREPIKFLIEVNESEVLLQNSCGVRVRLVFVLRC